MVYSYPVKFYFRNKQEQVTAATLMKQDTKKVGTGTFPGGPEAKTQASKAGTGVLQSWSRNGSHKLQLKITHTMEK